MNPKDSYLHTYVAPLEEEQARTREASPWGPGFKDLPAEERQRLVRAHTRKHPPRYPGGK